MRNRFLMIFMASVALVLFSVTLRPYGAAQTRAPAALTAQPMKINESFTLGAIGDWLEHQPMAKLADPGFQSLIKVLRDADVSFANLENPVIDSTNALSSGMRGDAQGGMPKTVLGDLKAMGIGMVNHANNHTWGRGAEGMTTTLRLLDEAGIIHAGAGEDLQQARSARFLTTPKGVVGLVGMFSIDNVNNPGFLHTAATYSMGGVPGTPGTNALHLRTYHVVSAEQLETLRKIRDSIYARPNPGSAKEPADRLEMLGSWYKVGPRPGALSSTMNPEDLREILRTIRNGKMYADFMIATIHCHQYSSAYQQYGGDSYRDGNAVDFGVPDFLVDLAHQAIDNGADAFIGHGVHMLRGVEIYKGKPVFYGLGSFLFSAPQYPTLVVPSANGDLTKAETSGEGWKVFAFGHPQASMEPLMVTSRYEEGKLVEVRLYPVDTGQDEEMRQVSHWGIPMTPSPAMARKILEKVQTLSKAFGTTISIENNVGVIHVSPEPQQSRR